MLRRNQEEIRRRAGRGIELAMVSRRNVEAARAIVGDDAGLRWSSAGAYRLKGVSSKVNLSRVRRAQAAEYPV